MDGFPGTRGNFMSDLLIIALAGIVPYWLTFVA